MTKKTGTFRGLAGRSVDMLQRHWFEFLKIFAVFYVPFLLVYYLFWENKKLIRWVIDTHSVSVFRMLDDISCLVILLMFVIYLLAVMCKIQALGKGRGAGVWEMYQEAFSTLGEYVIIKLYCIFRVLGWSLLLVVPGLIFAALYSFAGLALIVDGKKGKDALVLSQKIVRPNVAQFLIYTLSMALLVAGGSYVCAHVFFSFNVYFKIREKFLFAGVSNSVCLVLIAMAGIYFLVFYNYLYEELKRKAGYNVTG